MSLYSFDEKHNAHYYVNKLTKRTQWEHPLDAEYKLLVDKARRKHQDLSDTVSELDSGIRSLQGNEEYDTTPDSGTQMKVEQTIFGPPKGGLLPITGRERIQLQPLEPVQLRPSSAIRKVGKFEISKSNFNTQSKIDLSFNTNQKEASGSDTSKPSFLALTQPNKPDTSPKKGFTLTGGGSLFLKSNTRRQSDGGVGGPESTNSPLSLYSGATSKPIDIGESRSRDSLSHSPNVKGILRDSSLTDVRSRFTDLKLGGSDFDTTNDGDRKIVRFNLNPAEIRANSADDQKDRGSKSSSSSDDQSESAEEEEDIWDFVDEQAGKGVKQVKVTPAVSPISPITQLAILKSGNHSNETIKKTTIKAAIGKPEPFLGKPSIFALFDKGLDGKKESMQPVRPLYDESESESSSNIKKPIQNKMSMFEHEVNKASNYKELENMLEDEKKKFKDILDSKLERLKSEQTKAMERELKNEEIKFKELLESKRKEIEDQHLHDVLKAKEEARSKLNEIKEGINLQNEEELESYKAKLQAEFEEKRKRISDEYRTAADTLQKNHNEMLEELERDLKLEQEIVKKEHAQKLQQMRASVEHEIEVERHRMRENGEDRLYEKVRCEKRLLEDKYRCLKEKYVRLKNDVKISLERRNRRREQQTSITTTGSETERTPSNNRNSGADDKGTASGTTADHGKPPMGIVSNAKQKLKLENEEEKVKYTPTVKHLKFLQQHHQNADDTTSISQSDTTISNNYNRRRLNVPTAAADTYGENGNSDSEAFVRSAPKASHDAFNRYSNNNNNNFPTVGRQKRKLFTRSKSASTSRLHTSMNHDQDRPCTPIENLRTQLQKLEDLEDQFPDNTLDTPYRLRYPFTDIGNQGGGSTELEFFKHRIHLEKDSVRRAKESLRTQRTNFRAKQREIKQRHATSAVRHSVDQLVLVRNICLKTFSL